MKTALQELLDYTNDLLHTFDSEERVAMAVLDYLKTNEKAMLQKEREIICNAFSDARHGAVESRWTAEEYFEETFNTKEK
jgi:hypothetical protein